MNQKDYEKTDEEFDFIISAAESGQEAKNFEDLRDAVGDIERSIGRIKRVMNGLERSSNEK